MRTWVISSLGILLAFAATASRAQAGPSQKPAEKKAATRAAAASQEQRSLPASEGSTYLIGPQDILDITVWKEPEVSRTVPVRPDGKISLPLLNDVQAAGLTPMQLTADITQALRKFLNGPQVTVMVKEINSRRIFVVGEVARPGAFPMFPNMTVLQALSTAGGFTQFAKLSGIYVLRNENGRQAIYPFNYKDVIRGLRPEQNIGLKPGDTIVVP